MVIDIQAPGAVFSVMGQIPAKYVRLLREDFGEYLDVRLDAEEQAAAELEKMRQTPGGTLYYYRTSRNMSQAQVARELGVAKQYISNMEHNLKPIPAHIAAQLADLFGADAAEFRA